MLDKRAAGSGESEDLGTLENDQAPSDGMADEMPMAEAAL